MIISVVLSRERYINMSDSDKKLKDLTEMERLVIGSSLNFVCNIFNNQIFHIQHHDPELTEMLSYNEIAQEQFILLNNFKDVATELSKVFGETFSNMTQEQMDALYTPGHILDSFFEQIYSVIACSNN